MYAVLRSPEEIVFGRGARRAVSALVAARGSRALIIADPFLADSVEIGELRTELEAAGLRSALFTDVVPELPVSAILSAVRAAADFEADIFIAIGGGSSIDTAKMAAVVLAHGGDVPDYYGEGNVPGPIAPIIAVPTTAGTGSEVTPVAVVTDPARESKVGVSSPYLIPAVAVCDPELTLSCPPSVTAASGADALSHAIESYTARKGEVGDLASSRVFMGASALTDLLGLEAIRCLAAGLAQAYRQPDDIQARTLTMFGSLLAGLAFGTAGTAAAHALQYPIGAVTHTSHGVGVGLLLPHAMALNAPARQQELADVARAMGAGDKPVNELADAAPQLVRDLMTQIGIPHTLEELGFPRDRLDWAAEQGTHAKRLADNNPVGLTVEAARAVLEAAYAGTLSFDPETLGASR
ncbi:iron-containing alcohol dehydrogenase [Microbacterium sp. I2]|uniref:iron-containing alcohol dehydrogenase n=1 Tax=Microbacterium sp. I2 TaxID=3391826 RepID=UPI003EDA101B